MLNTEHVQACMHTHAHKHTRTPLHIHTHSFTHIHTFTHTRTYTHACTHARMHAHTHTGMVAKFGVNAMALKRAWESSQRVTKEDWCAHVWWSHVSAITHAYLHAHSCLACAEKSLPWPCCYRCL